MEATWKKQKQEMWRGEAAGWEGQFVKSLEPAN